MTAKAPKFWHTLNQAPRSAKDNGQHRRTSPPVHGRPAGQSNYAWPQRTPIFTPGHLTWVSFDEAPAKPIENAGIKAGEIIAYRGWRVLNGELVSIYKRQHTWKPGEPMTGDVRGAYGVHAFKTHNLVEKYCDIYSCGGFGWVVVFLTADGPKIEEPVFAIGTVALWGEVIEHEHGYRAEYAKIASLDHIIGADDQVLAELRAKYLCTVNPSVRE